MKVWVLMQWGEHLCGVVSTEELARQIGFISATEYDADEYEGNPLGIFYETTVDSPVI